MGLADAEFVRLGAQEVARRLEELRAAGGFSRDIRANNQYERDKLAYAKKLAKEEAQRHKEQARWDIQLFVVITLIEILNSNTSWQVVQVVKVVCL